MLQTLISALCVVLPRRLTGELRPIARRKVRQAFLDNETQQTFSQGKVPAIVHWAGGHPVLFAISIGAIAALMGGSAEWLSRDCLTFLLPSSIANFNVVEFFGPAWGVQATLVALVYPIVFSFVAVLIQRKASAKVMLRVYMLESGVLPAGLSSLLLTGVMTVEYFLLPYLASAWLTFMLFFNGTWLLANIALAGYFLTKTSRFLQDEAGHLALTRLAVGRVLRDEVENSLVQELCAGLPEHWGNDSRSVSAQGASVSMVGWSTEGDSVSRSLKGLQRLVDIRAGVLRFALSLATARPVPEASPARRSHSSRYAASFSPPFGRAVSGEIVLGYVYKGQSLTGFERALIRSAFVFRPDKGTSFQLTTNDMLQELMLDAQALAEQRRFTAAREAFLTAVRLHANLLSACEQQADSFNSAAQLHREPYRFFGSDSFHGSWLDLYRPLATIAVNVLEEDSSLFEAISYTPSKLAGLVKTQPFSLHAESMLVPGYLLYRLAIWWTRRVQAIGGDSHLASSIKLSEPSASIYRQALIAFIGGWSSFQIRIPESSEGELRWWQICNRAKAYCRHVEESARLLLDAVARKDEEASTWLGDHFIKWWGTKQFELEIDDIDGLSEFSHIDYSLLEMTYAQARDVVRSLDGGPGSDAFIEQAANLALRRYWEAFRLLIACSLLANARANTAIGSLELKVASHFILGKEFNPGSRAVCDPYRSTDNVLSAVISICFTDKKKTSRLDGFFEKLQTFKKTPMVSGWTYGGSVPRTDVESFKFEFVAILLALVKPSRRHVSGVWGTVVAHPRSHAAFGWLYDDIESLKRISNFGEELSQCLWRPGSLSLMSFANVLRAELGLKEITPGARYSVWLLGRALRTSALWDQEITHLSRTVSSSHLSTLTSQVLNLAFPENQGSSEAYSFCTVSPGKVDAAKPHAYSNGWFSIDELHEGASREFNTSMLDHVAQELRRFVVVNALMDLIDERKLKPATGGDDSQLIEDVAKQCSAIQAAGKPPIILGTSNYVRALSPHYDDAQTDRVPAGVTLKRPNLGTRTSVRAYLNGTPVFEVALPGDACYVIPGDLIDTVTLQGESLSKCFAVSHERKGAEKVILRWSWASAA